MILKQLVGRKIRGLKLSCRVLYAGSAVCGIEHFFGLSHPAPSPIWKKILMKTVVFGWVGIPRLCTCILKSQGRVFVCILCAVNLVLIFDIFLLYVWICLCLLQVDLVLFYTLCCMPFFSVVSCILAAISDRRPVISLDSAVVRSAIQWKYWYKLRREWAFRPLYSLVIGTLCAWKLAIYFSLVWIKLPWIKWCLSPKERCPSRKFYQSMHLLCLLQWIDFSPSPGWYRVNFHACFCCHHRIPVPKCRLHSCHEWRTGGSNRKWTLVFSSLSTLNKFSLFSCTRVSWCCNNLCQWFHHWSFFAASFTEEVTTF